MVSKIFKRIVIVVDYCACLFLIPVCMIGSIFGIPWILSKRRAWQDYAKGNRKVLFILPIFIERLDSRGYGHLLPFSNPHMNWTAMLDPVSTTEVDIKLKENFHLIAWKSPKIVRFLAEKKFQGISTILRELIAVIRITSYCGKERIGILRAFKHHYPALRAFLVSRLIKIPYIVDIT